jgi:hypothetical protein
MSAPSPDPHPDLRKLRQIAFQVPHPDPEQATSAARLLGELEGIETVAVHNPTRLSVSYRLPRISLRLIEEALGDLGFHLDNSLMTRLRRALIYYTEETQCANLGCAEGQSNCTTKVFVNRYQQLKHGCRDERPSHWREYL